MQAYTEILIRTIGAFAILLLIARVLGKQTISNMTFHDFASGITMGAIAANLAFNEKIQTSYFVFSLAVFTVTSYVVSKLALKSHTARKWISGAPTVLIDRGKILEHNMKKIKYTMDSLNQSLREKDIFNISEVEYAILENNGKLSVQRKDQYQHVTKKDLHLQTKSMSTFPIELIMDGKVIEKNLSENDISMEWLVTKIAEKGKELADVFYAVKATNGQIVFDFYKDNIKAPVDKEWK